MEISPTPLLCVYNTESFFLRQPIDKASWKTHGAAAVVNAFYSPPGTGFPSFLFSTAVQEQDFLLFYFLQQSRNRIFFFFIFYSPSGTGFSSFLISTALQEQVSVFNNFTSASGNRILFFIVLHCPLETRFFFSFLHSIL
jgi:hypothetical protein